MASDYQRALDFLFARTTGAFKFGLSRTRELLAALGDPHLAVPCLHVAGTNGKGSTVATAAALLRARGHRVATYTSPHLVDFRERIVVAGEQISADFVVDFVDRNIDRIETIGASFFEATTAMAFEYIAASGADFSVIEVGLGGRLDSTNVVQPRATAVVSIGLDHTEYLGDTIDAIAAEKAGIFKANVPALIGESDRRVAALLAQHARDVGAGPILCLDDIVAIDAIDVSATGTTFRTRALIQPVDSESRVTTPLVGRHQARNTVMAWLLACAALGDDAVPLDDLSPALVGLRLAGRFDRVGPFLFDVAHNPAGTAVLADTLRETGLAPARIAAVVGVLADKDWRGMLRALAPAVGPIVATMPPTAPDGRRWSLSEVRDFAISAAIDVRIEPDFDAALAIAQALGDVVLVTGSFHTVGDAMARLQVTPGHG